MVRCRASGRGGWMGEQGAGRLGAGATGLDSLDRALCICPLRSARLARARARATVPHCHNATAPQRRSATPERPAVLMLKLGQRERQGAACRQPTSLYTRPLYPSRNAPCTASSPAITPS